MLDPHSITLTRDEARTATAALCAHALRCNAYADQCMDRRSSDRTVSQNAYDAEVARDYRRMASECDALRARINQWLDASVSHE